MNNESFFIKLLNFFRNLFGGKNSDVVNQEEQNIVSNITSEQSQELNKNDEECTSKKLTKAQSIALDFWTRLNEKISEKGSQLSTRKPNTDSSYHFAVGSSKACVLIFLAYREKCVTTGLWIKDSKELFDELAKNKKEIERKLKFSMDWDRKDESKASSITLRIYDVDFEDRQSWDSLIDDLIVKCELLQNVFKEYIK